MRFLGPKLRGASFRRLFDFLKNLCYYIMGKYIYKENARSKNIPLGDI